MQMEDSHVAKVTVTPRLALGISVEIAAAAIVLATSTSTELAAASFDECSNTRCGGAFLCDYWLGDKCWFTQLGQCNHMQRPPQ
jgi:hypothetical protein